MMKASRMDRPRKGRRDMKKAAGMATRPARIVASTAIVRERKEAFSTGVSRFLGKGREESAGCENFLARLGIEKGEEVLGGLGVIARGHHRGGIFDRRAVP